MEGNIPILKKTDWFMMSYAGTHDPIPQTSEGITKATWFQDTQEPLLNTYQSIIEIVTQQPLT